MTVAVGRSHYRLAHGISLRRESFGGLAYSYGTRRLVLIYSAEAVAVALALDEDQSPERIAAQWVSDGRQPDLDAARRHVTRIIGRLIEKGLLE